jgi:hypothetical protein
VVEEIRRLDGTDVADAGQDNQLRHWYGAVQSVGDFQGRPNVPVAMEHQGRHANAWEYIQGCCVVG